MELALIPPNAMLSHSGISDIQMLLPQELISNQEYCGFYRQLHKAKPGRLYIMDNGAAEAATIPMSQLLELVSHWGVHEFVIPDVLADPGRTYDSLNNFFSWNFGTLSALNIGVKKDSTTKLGFVAQGHNFHEALTLVRRVIHSPWSKYISVIYLPFLLLRVSSNRDERIKLAMRVHEEYPHIPVHFLGGSTIWPREAIAAKELGFVRSMDTSLPYKLAYHDPFAHIGDVQSAVELSRPENYFQRNWTEEERTAAKDNVETMLSWL